MNTKLPFGLEQPYCKSLNKQIKEAELAGYHFIIVPLVHPRYKRNLLKCSGVAVPLTRSDMIMTGDDWNKLVVGQITDVDADSEITEIRENSTAILEQELNFASHLGLQVVTLRVKSIKCFNTARIVSSCIAKGSLFKIWVRLPMTYRQVSHRSNAEEPTTEDDPWELWNNFRIGCNYRRSIELALEMSTAVPSEAEVERWLGEPVKCIIIPTSLFLTNQHGFPVLSKTLQHVVHRLSVLDIQFIIKEKTKHKELSLYNIYIDHLVKTGPVTLKCKGYEDVLQHPLQPLKDNLEAQVYEIFEKDHIKYTQYQNAIEKALEDRVPKERRADVTVTIMVVGAGRGPLVQASLNAGEISNIKLRVYAVEKNPMAINTLCALNDELWNGRVEIVQTDMRDFSPETKADILVSELLGSFGDNELSPECLDGAQHLLKEDGISIPCSYTAFVAPLHSPKLLMEIRAQQPNDKTLVSCFETIYVVHLVNYYQIAPAQACWSFKHPNKTKPINNKRMVTLRFKATQNCIMTGFVGYFDTELYKDIKLSTEPRTHSNGMISWFPLFFPLQEVTHIKQGDTIEICLWRCVARQNVWYEWCVNKPVPGTIYNVNGKSFSISL